MAYSSLGLVYSILFAILLISFANSSLKPSNNITNYNIGLGTYMLQGPICVVTVKHALHAGYRIFDTAPSYGNERDIGLGIDEFLSEQIYNGYQVPNDILVVDKLPGNTPPHNVLKVFHSSRHTLGRRIDIYLVHWPASTKNERIEIWKEMMKILATGLVQMIGVSNYDISHLEELLSEQSISVKPAVNQIEFNPGVFKLTNHLLEYCLKNKITVMAYTPLGQPALLSHPLVQFISTVKNQTAAQILIQWSRHMGTIPIVKSEKLSRLTENIMHNFFLDKNETDDLSKILQFDQYVEAV